MRHRYWTAHSDLDWQYGNAPPEEPEDKPEEEPEEEPMAENNERKALELAYIGLCRMLRGESGLDGRSRAANHIRHLLSSLEETVPDIRECWVQQVRQRWVTK